MTMCFRTTPLTDPPPIARKLCLRTGMNSSLGTCVFAVIWTGQRYVNIYIFSLAHRPKEPSHGQIDDVDELSFIDHNDIMNRITLKAEVIIWFKAK